MTDKHVPGCGLAGTPYLLSSCVCYRIMKRRSKQATVHDLVVSGFLLAIWLGLVAVVRVVTGG